MRVVTDFLSEPAFEILSPAEQTSPFVSTRRIRARPTRSTFSPCRASTGAASACRKTRMWTKLFMAAVEAGAPLLRGISPAPISTSTVSPTSSIRACSKGVCRPLPTSGRSRVAGGLGTVPRVISDSEEIYARPLPVEAALDRIETLYKPYHAALTRCLPRRMCASVGCADRLPFHAVVGEGAGPQGACRLRAGDRHGTSSARALVDHVANVLSGFGYKVAINRPYAAASSPSITAGLARAACPPDRDQPGALHGREVA